jgi:hypothetical protein
MADQAESKVPDEGSLDVLVEAERQLDQQLEEARRQADQRVQQARVAAQERVGRERQRIAADAARRLAEGQQASDDSLARETRTKEQELARTWTNFAAFRAALSARMLAEVLGR